MSSDIRDRDRGIPFSLWPYRRVVRELPRQGTPRRYPFLLSCGHTIIRASLQAHGDSKRCEHCAYQCVTLEDVVRVVIPRETRPLWQRALESRA